MRQGQILEVTVLPAGSELEAVHPAGSTSLQVNDLSDFASTGGQVSIDVDEDTQHVYDYTGVDPSLNTILLASPTTIEYEEAQQVLVYPPYGEKWAMVETEQDREPPSAKVSHALRDRIAEGVRDPEQQEAVLLDIVDGDLTVIDLVREDVSIDASFIDPYTVTGQVAASWDVVVTGQLEAASAQAQQDLLTLQDTLEAADNTLSLQISASTQGWQDADTAINERIDNLNGQARIESTSPPGATSNAAGTIWEQYDNLGSTKRKLIGAWRGLGGTSWVPVALDPVYIPVLDISTGTAGILSAGRLQVTDLTDLLMGAGTSADVARWVRDTPSLYSTLTDATNPSPYGPLMIHVAPNGTENAMKFDVPARVGDTWRLTGKARHWGGGFTQGNVQVGVWWLDKNGASIGTAGADQVFDGGNFWDDGNRWVDIDVLVPEAPAGTATGRVHIYLASANGGYVDIAGLTLRRRFGGELLVDGSIAGHHVQANTIGVEKLVVSDFTNYVRDPGFEKVAASGWNTMYWSVSDAAHAWIDTTYPNKAGGAGGALVLGSGNYNEAYSNLFDVRAGELFNLTVDVQATGSASGSWVARLYWYDSNGAYLSYNDCASGSAGGIPEGSWYTTPQPGAYWTGNATVPAGAVRGRVTLIRYDDVSSGFWLFDNVRVKKRFGGELLVDGSVQAQHFNGNTFVGVTMTAPLFQTVAASNRGIKILSSDNGAYGRVIAYDSTGAPVFDLNGQTGAISMKGNLTSGSIISGAQINGSVFTSVGSDGKRIGIGNGMNSGSGGFELNWAPGWGFPEAQPSSIYNWASGAYGSMQPVLTIASGSGYGTAASDRAYMEFFGRNQNQNVGTQINLVAGNVWSASSIETAHDIIANAGWVYTTRVQSQGASLTLGTQSAGSAVVDNNGLTVGGSIGATGTVSGTKVFASAPDTPSSSTPNVRWAGAGQFTVFGTGSASRYKENVVTLDDDEVADLGLRVVPVEFNYKEEYGWGTRRLWGFMAEQVRDAGVERLVEYEDGEIEGVDYPHWVVVLQAIARRQHREIKDLRNRLERAGL